MIGGKATPSRSVESRPAGEGGRLINVPDRRNPAPNSVLYTGLLLGDKLTRL